jgi:hypothetical protein
MTSDQFATIPPLGDNPEWSRVVRIWNHITAILNSLLRRGEIVMAEDANGKRGLEYTIAAQTVEA